jgi:hypothetical protein
VLSWRNALYATWLNPRVAGDRRAGVARAVTRGAVTVTGMRPLTLPATIPVAGVSFRQGELRDVVEGDHVELVATDDNPHDANAVEIRFSEKLLGFVPRAVAERLRASDAERWRGVVSEVLRGETWGLRVTVHPLETELPRSARELKMRAIERGAQGRVDGEPAPGRDSDAPVTIGKKRVRALSGRDLGVLVRIEGSRVIVSDDAGREVSYPATVVTIEG